jgi:drug/metabolite transporter (DMT)-like permease
VFTKGDPVHQTDKEGSGAREDVVTDGDDPNTGGWRFFLWWMLAFLGFPIGGLLALVLVGSVEGAGSGALGGALAGAVIGAAQWLVLRRYPRARVGPEWILATALGLALGDALGASLTGAGTGLGAYSLPAWPPASRWGCCSGGSCGTGSRSRACGRRSWRSLGRSGGR